MPKLLRAPIIKPIREIEEPPDWEARRLFAGYDFPPQLELAAQGIAPAPVVAPRLVPPTPSPQGLGGEVVEERPLLTPPPLRQKPPLSLEVELPRPTSLPPKQPPVIPTTAGVPIVPTTAPVPPEEAKAKAPRTEESKLKDVWDAFRMGATEMIHSTKQAFLGPIADFLFSIQPEEELWYPPKLAKAAEKERQGMRETFGQRYEAAEQKHQEWLEAHPELQPREEWQGSVIDTISQDPKMLLDPAYIGYIVAESASFTLAFLGTSVAVGTATGNPFLGLGAGVALTAPAQIEDLYADLIANGATREQASTLSVPLGTVISSIEVVGAIPLLGTLSKPFSDLLRRNIQREVAAQTLKELAKRGLVRFTKVEIAEVLEEVAQGAIQDATVRTFNENRALLDNIPETAIRTAIATLPFAGVGVGGEALQALPEGVAGARLKELPAATRGGPGVERLPVEAPSTAVQAGMGIGEAPSQAELFAELGAGAPAEAAPLIGRESLEAKAAREAEIARGQAEMPVAKEPWQMPKKEFQGSAYAIRRINEGAAPEMLVDEHHFAVETALSEGKAVPPEVLADYPDLAPKPAEAPEFRKGQQFTVIETAETIELVSWDDKLRHWRARRPSGEIVHLSPTRDIQPALESGIWREAAEAPVAPAQVEAELTEQAVEPIVQAAAEPNIEPLTRERVSVSVGDLEYKPELFQARDADPGKAVSEKRVKQLVDAWDPNQFSPPSVVPDPDNPGKYIVYRGHHRAAAFERIHGADATIEVYVTAADIANPDQLQGIQLEGDASNFKTALPNFRETLRAVQRAETAGLSQEDVGTRLRKSVAEVEALQDAARLGMAVIDRVTTEATLGPVATELGRAMRVYKIRIDEAEAWFKRIADAPKGQRPTTTALRETIDKFGKRLKDVPPIMFEGLEGFEGTQSGILALMDDSAKARTNLSSQARRVATTAKRVKELTAVPGTAKADVAAARRLVRVAERQQTALEKQIRDLDKGILSALREAKEVPQPVTPRRERVAAEAVGALRTEAMEPSLVQPEAPQISAQAVVPSPTTRQIVPPSKAGPARIFNVGDIEPTSKRIILQPLDDVKQLLAQATAMEPALRATLETVAGEVPGSSVVGVRIKDIARVQEKIASGKPAQTLSDYLGGRMAVATLEDIERVVESVRRAGRIVEDQDFLAAPNNGYRARHIQLEMPNGMTAEVQIVPREIAEVQEQAHGFFEKFRPGTAPQAGVEAAQAQAETMMNGAWGQFTERTQAEVPPAVPPPPVTPPTALAAPMDPPPGAGSKAVLDQLSFEETPQSLKDKILGGYHSLRRSMLDDLYPIERFVDVAKQGGLEISIEENPYIHARLLRGIASKSSVFLEEGTFGRKFWKLENGKLVPDLKGPGLKQILETVSKPEKWRDLSAYMTARRARELAPRKIKTGIELKDAVAAIKELESKYPEFPELAQKLYKYQNDLLDYIYEAGLIDKAFLEKLRKSKAYVPFNRVFEDIQAKGFLGKKMADIVAPIRRMKGSERVIINPLESMMKNTQLLISAADRNQIGIMMANLVEKSPELEPLFSRVKTPTARVARVSAKELGITLEGITAADTEKVFDIFRPSLFTKENVVSVIMGGKKQFYHVDPDLYRGLLALDRDSLGLIAKIFGAPTKWLRAGATLNPDFVVRNPARDQMTAFAYSKYGYLPGLDFVRGMASFLGKEDTYQLYRLSGADHAALVSMDRDYLSKTFREVVEGRQFTDYVKHPLELLQIASEATERATRVGEFRLGVTRAETPFEPAFAARNVSLDFAQMGTTARSLNTIIAFFNANIRGTARMVSAFKEAPLKTSMKVAAGITIPSVLLYLANRNDPRWDEIPQWQKDLFWIVFLGDNIYRIPKPFELGILFGSVPERFLEFLDKREPGALTEVAMTALESGLPGFLPTALEPIIENLTNYSFFLGRPIVSRAKERFPPRLQYGGTTSETAKKLGDVLNQSPAKIDNMVYGYTAGLGRYATELLDRLLVGTGISPNIPEPSRTLADIPVIKGFVVRDPYGSSSTSVDEFYKALGRTQEGEAYLKEMMKGGNEQKFASYMKQHPELMYFYDFDSQTYASATARMLRQVSSQLSEISKKQELIYNSPTMSGEVKRQLIDSSNKAKTEIAKMALDKLAAMSKGTTRAAQPAITPALTKQDLPDWARETVGVSP